MKRLWVAMLGAVVASAVVATSAQAIAEATCSPQLCTTWQPAPVTVMWTSTIDGDVSQCNNKPPLTDDSPDNTGTPVMCNDGDVNGQGTILVKVDSEGPTFTVSPGPDQNGWYNHPEPLTVSNPIDALSGVGPGSCHDAGPYAGPDGAGVNAGGGCTDNAGNPRSVMINYDSTPPVVTVSPDRQPDHNGWYNHPVSFTVSGADATSGLAPCAGNTTYSGPANASASVVGSCTDNAGNLGIGARSFQYDASRPSAADVLVTPGNHRVELTWTLPGDANSVVVVRSAKGSSAAPTLVYTGTRRSLVDKHLHNGTKYSYTVTDIDPAGNSTAKTVRAIPTGSSLRPYVGSVVSAPPQLTWKKVKRASYYNVQVYLGRTKVLSTWPRKPSLQLPQSWHYRGKSYTLAAGHYRWYVWPGFGRLSSHRYGNRIGRSSFRVR